MISAILKFELNPNIFSVWFNKGIALFQLGKYNNAMDAWMKALKLDPNNIECLYYMAGIEALRNNKENSIKILEETFRLEYEQKSKANREIIYQERARTDGLFNNIRNTPEFQDLINRKWITYDY